VVNRICDIEHGFGRHSQPGLGQNDGGPGSSTVKREVLCHPGADYRNYHSNPFIVNFVYDASEPENRSKYIAIFNAMVGLFTCLGALVGGYLEPHLPAIFGYKLLTLFTISGLSRGAVAIFMFRFIREVRRVPQMKDLQLLLGRKGTR
jgi:hypothetical protein